MLKKLCLLLFSILIGAISGQAQLVKEYKVTERKGFDLVRLNFSTYKSLTQLRRVKTMDPVYIHGHLQNSNILPDFKYNLRNNILETSLIHKNIESDNLGKSITSKLFNSDPGFEHTWDLGLASGYLYDLDFNLGMGKADFDLSQIPVSTLKVKSASADVHIFYGNFTPNQVEMDTLLVVVNMGSLDVQNANFTNARKMIFEVNYGSIDLNFSDGMAASSQVIAAVSGGTVHVKLPPDNFPYRLKLKTTPMCRTTLPKSLRSLEKGIYVSKGYNPNDPKLLELIVDVGVGALTIE